MKSDNFFAELKRPNVCKVGVAYAAAAMNLVFANIGFLMVAFNLPSAQVEEG